MTNKKNNFVNIKIDKKLLNEILDYAGIELMSGKLYKGHTYLKLFKSIYKQTKGKK